LVMGHQTSTHWTLAMWPERVRSSQLASYIFGPAATAVGSHTCSSSHACVTLAQEASLIWQCGRSGPGPASWPHTS
jgi:hypothetical protein